MTSKSDNSRSSDVALLASWRRVGLVLSKRKCPLPTSALRNAGMFKSKLFSTPSLKHPRRESKALASSLHSPIF